MSGHGHGHEEEHEDDHGHGWHGHDNHWAEKSGSWGFWNRVGNLVSTPVRGVGTVWYVGLDLAKTLLAEPTKNVGQITSDSIDDISNLFQEAGKRGKWYHKALNLPLAGALSGVKAVEWACRSVVNTGWNAIRNTAHTAKNGVVNLFKTATSLFSKKPISDFSFEHLKTQPTWKTWDLTKFLVWWKSGGGDAHHDAPAVAGHH